MAVKLAAGIDEGPGLESSSEDELHTENRPNGGPREVLPNIHELIIQGRLPNIYAERRDSSLEYQSRCQRAYVTSDKPTPSPTGEPSDSDERPRSPKTESTGYSGIDSSDGTNSSSSGSAPTHAVIRKRVARELSRDAPKRLRQISQTAPIHLYPNSYMSGEVLSDTVGLRVFVVERNASHKGPKYKINTDTPEEYRNHVYSKSVSISSYVTAACGVLNVVFTLRRCKALARVSLLNAVPKTDIGWAHDQDNIQLHCLPRQTVEASRPN